MQAEMELWMGPIICYLDNGDLSVDKNGGSKMHQAHCLIYDHCRQVVQERFQHTSP